MVVGSAVMVVVVVSVLVVVVVGSVVVVGVTVVVCDMALELAVVEVVSVVPLVLPIFFVCVRRCLCELMIGLGLYTGGVLFSFKFGLF